MKIQTIIKDLQEIDRDYEIASEFWDESGLNMNLAVVPLKKDRSMLAISTKHWWRVWYLKTNLPTDKLWNVICDAVQGCQRSCVKSDGSQSVYISNLSANQTARVYEKILFELNNSPGTRYLEIPRWQLSWNIQNAVLPTF